MSAFNDIDMTCEQCGHEFRGTVWTAVNAKQDPELKDILLGGELNMVMCPECAHVEYHDHFVLYQDPSAELLAYVYPESEKVREPELRTMMITGFREAQNVYAEKDRIRYDPVLVFGLESLVEMMTDEEARGEQSQIAEVLCKEEKIPFVVLPPARARGHRLPRVLPVTTAGASPTRAEVLSGIDKLLAKNPALSIYSEVKSRLEKSPDWKL